MNAQMTWYIARAAGLVAWALTTAAVIWGLALSTRIAGRRPPPAWLADLHRFLGGLAVTFTAVHVVALLADDWVQFDVVDVLVPFAAQWRPSAVAWGVVALYLLAAVELTSLLRRRVPTRWWRAIHLASLPLFAAGTVHLLAAGTDAAAPWVRAAVLLAVTTVVYLTAARVLSPPRRGRRSAQAQPRNRGVRSSPTRGAIWRDQPPPVVPANDPIDVAALSPVATHVQPSVMRTKDPRCTPSARELPARDDLPRHDDRHGDGDAGEAQPQAIGRNAAGEP